jgi:hypothetical protein
MSQFRRQAPAASVRDGPTPAAEGRLSAAGG